MANLAVSTLTDAELVALYKNGDDATFGILYHRHRAYIKDVVRSNSNERMSKDDVLQEVFIKAFERIRANKYVEEGHFKTWLARVARNSCLDVIRNQRSANGSTFSSSLLPHDFPIELVSDVLNISEGSYEERKMKADEQREIRELIRLLPEEQRETVMMRYYAGMKFKDIATSTMYSINTVLGRERYALKNLRRLIQDSRKQDLLKISA